MGSHACADLIAATGVAINGTNRQSCCVVKIGRKKYRWCVPSEAPASLFQAMPNQDVRRTPRSRRYINIASIVFNKNGICWQAAWAETKSPPAFLPGKRFVQGNAPARQVLTRVRPYKGCISGMSADAAEFAPSRLAAALAQGHSEGEDPSSKKRRIEGFEPHSLARYNMFDDPEGSYRRG